MSDKKRHNVKTYLKACGMYKKVTEDMNPNVIINLMEGYAQLFHNNQKKANEVDPTNVIALPINSVVQQRELLIAFMDSLDIPKLTQIELANFEEVADEYLKSNL